MQGECWFLFVGIGRGRLPLECDRNSGAVKGRTQGEFDVRLAGQGRIDGCVSHHESGARMHFHVGPRDLHLQFSPARPGIVVIGVVAEQVVGGRIVRGALETGDQIIVVVISVTARHVGKILQARDGGGLQCAPARSGVGESGAAEIPGVGCVRYGRGADQAADIERIDGNLSVI